MTVYRNVRNRGDGPAELFIYDEVSAYGVTAKALIDDLRGLGARDVLLRINSPGGDVFDGLAIYDALRAHPGKVTVSIEGLAASIASVIAMAGTAIRATENSFLIIHDPLAVVIGTAADMTAMADLLVKIKSSLIGAYRRSGASEQKISDWMARETWFAAPEARAVRLVDAVGEPLPIVARFDLSRFRHPPAALATPTPADRWQKVISRQFPETVGGVRTAGRAPPAGQLRQPASPTRPATSCWGLNRRMPARGAAKVVVVVQRLMTAAEVAGYLGRDPAWFRTQPGRPRRPRLPRTTARHRSFRQSRRRRLARCPGRRERGTGVHRVG